MIEQEQIPADIIEQQYQLFLKNNTRPDSPEKTGDSITPDEQEIKKEIEQNLHVQKLLEKLNAAIPKPSEKEIASYYRDHADQFHLPEMVRVSHIVKHLNPGADTRKVYEQMEQVLLELKDNVDFADVARRWSDCPDNGGDLGYFLRGQMVPEFETVVFDLEPGQVSGIFQTSFGLHITKLWEKKPPGARPLKEVRQTIIDHLMQQDQKTALEDYLDLLKEKAVIEDK
ncbi:MAG: peptidylprolyl isomerase [Sedimentisphaerales bacterium]|nr:peptidylprolyl isomerase [Sedimentisphaerales bacterium]